MIKGLWPSGSKNSRQKRSGSSANPQLTPANYEPLDLPNRGNPADLTELQVSENSDYLLGVLESRVLNLKRLLREHDIIWPDNLAGIDYDQPLTATRKWAKQTWPTVRPMLASVDIRKHWLQGDRDGDFTGLSMVTDTALLLGELIIANRPSLNWGMDRDSANKDDGMATTNRLVLIGEWLPDPSVSAIIDIESMVLTLFCDPDDSSERLFNTWKTLVDDCLSGKHEGIALVG